jgi:hypothetical protein
LDLVYRVKLVLVIDPVITLNCKSDGNKMLLLYFSLRTLSADKVYENFIERRANRVFAREVRSYTLFV